MLYRWKNGEGEWVFIPIHLIKNSYLKMIYKRYKKQVIKWENLLIKYLTKSSNRGISVALKALDNLAAKLTAISEEFIIREHLGIHNFRYKGRIDEQITIV